MFYFLGSSTYHVLPGGVPGGDSYELFCTLVKVLSEDNKYAVTQRIYSKNNYPKYFVLKPEPHSIPPRFVMTSLPYADDLVKHVQCVKPEKSDQQNDEDSVVQFCQSIDITHDKCTLDVPLAPCMVKELFTDNIIKTTASKLCNTQFDFSQVDPFDFDSFHNNPYWDLLQKNLPDSTGDFN